MIKIFTLLLLMIVSSNARENPFFPSSGEVDITMTTNQVQESARLKRAAVTLPSTARTIESITIKYKILDGSIHEKTEVLQNSIDWHLPIFVSQNIADSQSTENMQKVKKKKSVKKKKFVKIASLKFISLYERKRELKIITKDKLIRNFLLVKPHRIVCDFKRDIDIRSYTKDINTKSIVKKVKLGNHKGYYRVVIELDGYYRYKVKKVNDTYMFTLL